MRRGQYKVINLKHIVESDVEKATPPESVQGLVDRIKRHGPYQVVFVRPIEEDPEERYAAVSGHRYLKAVRLSRTDVDVPCLVRYLALTEEEFGAHLRENLKQEDPWDQAWDMRQAQELFEWTQEEIAKYCGLSQGFVCERLAMPRICGFMPDLITARHDINLSYRAIATLKRVIKDEPPDAVSVGHLRTIAARMIDERWPAKHAATRVNACLAALRQGLPLPETKNLMRPAMRPARTTVRMSRIGKHVGGLRAGVPSKVKGLLSGLKRLAEPDTSEASILEGALIRELLAHTRRALLDLQAAEPIFRPFYEERIQIAREALATVGWEIRFDPEKKRPEVREPEKAWTEM
jgi:ParB-like chromosome segregation protein Spo0J